MNITGTGIAVAIAVVIAMAFLFFGPRILQPLTIPTATSAAPVTQATSTQATTTMEEATNPAAPAGETRTLADGLVITDEIVGTGAEAKAGSTVTVSYVGSLQNGTVFDASANHGGTFSFPLGAGQVIKGWDEGVAGMKEGGKRRLVIPPALGYGNQAVGGVIPANATLIFEVELVKAQ